jgi:hypothetical protein
MNCPQCNNKMSFIYYKYCDHCELTDYPLSIMFNLIVNDEKYYISIMKMDNKTIISRCDKNEFKKITILNYCIEPTFSEEQLERYLLLL